MNIKLNAFYKKYQSNYDWWNIRFFAILLSSIVFIDFEILFLIQSFLFAHLILGFKNILQDYIHNLLLKHFCFIMLRLFFIEFIKSSVEIFL